MPRVDVQHVHVHEHEHVHVYVQELLRYEQDVALAQEQLQCWPAVPPAVRRMAVDSFAKKRQATSNYAQQCSHVDTMQQGADAMEWKVTASFGTERMAVQLGENGSRHPPLLGMLLYDAFR